MKLSLTSKTKPTQGVSYQVKSRRLALAALGGLAVLSTSAVPAFAGTAAKQVAPVETSSIWEKPAWLTDLSLRVGESYDTNVYLGGVDVAAGDNVATKNKSSAVTTISPKIGVDFAKLLDKDSVLKVFSFGYVPDFVIFSDASTESYSAHRFTTAIKGKANPVSFSLENAFTYIDGDKDGLFYPSGASAYANGTIRERRNQWQDRSKASVKIDLNESFFVRPTASLLYYDLGTNFLPSTTPPGGYTNFIDRYDLNGGADIGYNVSKTVAFTAGYRYGHQEQANLPLNVDPTQTNASSDYQRVLFGVEGSPLKWLKVEASVGPQFTSYTDSRPLAAGGNPTKIYSYSKDKKGHITEKVKLVATTEQIEQDPTDVYAEASVTIAPTASDVLVLKYKRWDWVSSTGKNAYLDTLYDASFRHQITKALQLEVGVRASNSDYNPSALRNDWLYTTSAGLKYAVTKNLSLDLTYSYDRGRNDQLVNSVTVAKTASNYYVAPNTRQFERSIVSTGVTWKF